MLDHDVAALSDAEIAIIPQSREARLGSMTDG
jgi:hypothetical protein